MSVIVPIAVRDVVGQQTITLAPTTQEWNWAKIKINRSGTGGTHPWLNSLTSADSLGVAFGYSFDGGNTWKPMSPQTVDGDGTRVVKGVLVPQVSEVGVGIGTTFPAGTTFRIVLTASTPLTFDGSAELG
jgi:hypothetical protein